MIDFQKHLIVGCIPKEHLPEAPDDQTPCIIENCPICEKEMWVSELKRELRKTRSKVKIFCFICIVKEQIRQGLTQKDVEVLNLSKVQ